MSLTDQSASAVPAPPGDRADGTIEVVLHGGPDSLPPELRTNRVAGDQEKLKVPHYGGYEHFERLSAETDAEGRVVYFWTGRTRVAE
jgi:hypothetical protein